mgnify:CR=1 FL=1
MTLELGTDQGLVGVGVTFFGEALLGAGEVGDHLDRVEVPGVGRAQLIRDPVPECCAQRVGREDGDMLGMAVQRRAGPMRRSRAESPISAIATGS